jgi:hypothetical protein
VLLDAVEVGVVSMTEAQLIGATRLEHVPVFELAAQWGLRPNTLIKRRRRAEERLRTAIASGAVASRFDLADAPAGAPMWSQTPQEAWCDDV